MPTFDVLLVEDNPGDVDLVREGFAESGIDCFLHAVSDGDQALGYLRGNGEHTAAARPDLILLDLNIPRRDGRQVLSEIKNDPALRTIPVVVLTSSEAETDIAQAYSLHANCFIQKPITLDEYTRMIHAVIEFWFRIVKLPME